MAGTSLKIEQFIRLFYNLLPKGRAWNEDIDSDTYKLVSSLSQEFCRNDDRLEDLIREIDPFQTNELLDDWLATYGLPNPCLGDVELSDDDKRTLLLQQLNATGGASESYFEGILDNSGFQFDTDVIPLFLPFVAGSRAGDKITNGQEFFTAGSVAGSRLHNSGWTYWFEVHSGGDNIIFVAGSLAGEPLTEFGLGTIATRFRAGDRAGQRLSVFGNERLECIIRKDKPAHTAVLFTYGPET